MTGEQITAAIGLVTGCISTVLSLLSVFPINLICAAFIAGLAIGLVRKIMKIFRKK